MEKVSLNDLIVIWCIINLASAANNCWVCPIISYSNTICDNHSCNLTQAQNCSSQSCSSNCLCVTTFANSTLYGFTLYSTCSPSCADGNSVKQLLDLTSQSQIDGRFVVIDSKSSWTYECGSDDCNKVVTFDPLYVCNETGIWSNFTLVENPSHVITTVSLSVAGSLFILLGVVFIIIRCRYYKNKNKMEDNKFRYGHQSLPDDSESFSESDLYSDSTYKTKADSASSSVATQYTRSSNNGESNPLLLPIFHLKRIASGRYAKVYQAQLMQEKDKPIAVSVKSFSLRNYGAWRQEIDMLNESWMHHENIIEYYTAEKRLIRKHLEYWLVTAYYKQGNLANYLFSNPLSWNQLCGMILSIANGLSYLHAEHNMNGEAKVPIAHRDIKSTNILVKDDQKSCVIADFGLSLKLDPKLTREDWSNAGQVGTSRYMAPELLERLVNLFDPESFKRVDVYAMALVMWEMMNCCDAVPGMASPYKPVFADHINEFPNKNQMLMLVCKNRRQPEIKSSWEKHKGMSLLCRILPEMWEYIAEERITAGCVVERINIIKEQSFEVEEEEYGETEKLLCQNHVEDD